VPAKRHDVMSHPIVITLLIFAVVGFMWWTSEVLKPLALAILLSFALAPIASFFERRGLPRPAAVVLTVLLALGVLAGIGYQVGREFTDLAAHIDQYEERILKKLERPEPTRPSTLDKLSKVGEDLSRALDKPPTVKDLVNVNVVSQPSFTQRLKAAVGPYLEYLGMGTFVLILVLFMLMGREDLRDRIVRLFGSGRVSLTTKTMDEVGLRISRYLAMLATVNASFGLVVGVGLWAIGVPLAILWGVLAALLRFIPYVGPATAFALPLIFSFASFNGWREPLMVIALFATLEVLMNTFLEPVIYGKTTGVSALGLLVAAMFWTWLWGPLGLLLSTPLTVCLAVLGKTVPGLGVFATLLSEEEPLEPDVRLYQRLLAVDQDGAATIVDDALSKRPRAEVFEEVLIPVLSRAERDHGRDDIDDRERAFVWRFVADVLDELEATPDEITLQTVAQSAPVEASPTEGAAPTEAETASPRILGVAINDHADELALRMLSLLLAPSGMSLEVVGAAESPLKLAEQLAERDPGLVVLSHLPPSGLTAARYMVRRLRARFPRLPILVGRWGQKGDTTEAVEGLKKLGATDVAFRLSDARDAILERLAPKPEAEPLAPAAVPG
jgi:predicted PurR-regulated permease PerM/methylmalonyl-CoA mutase cobalamin-binding subunit